MKKTEPIYSCTMQILYIICRAAWDFCTQHLAAFTNFKSKYTTAYITAALQAIKSAEAINTVQQRNSNTNDMRQELEENARLLCDTWQDLKRYIASAYSGARLRIALVDAGSKYYTKAATYNWSNLQSLANAGNDFISNNLQRLQDDGYMPAAFQARFAANAQACTELYEDYFDTDRKKTLVATDKVAANNAIYTNMMDMLDDAKSVFRDSPLAKQFTLAHLLSQARGYGFGSLKGYVTDATTAAPLEGVAVSLIDKKNRTVTSRTGRYGLARVAAGTYTLQLVKENYAPVQIEVIVNTGTSATYSVQLQKVAVEVQGMKVA